KWATQIFVRKTTPVGEFQEATVSLSSRVSDMANMTGIPEDAFVRLSHAATAAHEKCLEARDRFYNHLAEHRCWTLRVTLLPTSSNFMFGSTSAINLPTFCSRAACDAGASAQNSTR